MPNRQLVSEILIQIAEAIYNVCSDDIELLEKTIKLMIEEL